jgi:shikimate dehydrogenase
VIKQPRRLVLLGRSLAHTLSPRFQNAALRHEGINITYEALDIPSSSLDDVLDELEREGGAGNVTVPYKAKVFERCEHLSPIAQRVGAINTFWFERGEMYGDNTDVGGFAHAVTQLVGAEPRDATIGVLGAGGAAAAVLAAIEQWSGCTVLLHNRTAEHADSLCARFSTIARPSGPDLLARGADLVVNATTVGLRDHEVPLDPGGLKAGAAVLDLVYRNGETAWVRAARARGLRAMDGLPMLIEQGALAFERWFGFAPNREVMWASVR